MANAQKPSDDACAKCGRPGFPLYENPKRPKQFLCFPCLDAEAPAVVNRYPGWRQREAAQQRRADQAKLNFGQT